MNPSEKRIGKSSDAVDERVGEEQKMKASIGNNGNERSCGKVKEVFNSFSGNCDEVNPGVYDLSRTLKDWIYVQRTIKKGRGVIQE